MPGLLDLSRTAARLYRSNVRLFAGAALMVTVLQSVEVVYAPSRLTLLIFVALWPMITGVLSRAIESAYLGRPAQSVRAVYASIGWKRFLLLAAANVVVTVMVVLGLILLIVPGVYLWVRYQFVPQAIVLDRAGFAEAFRRSSAIIRGFWWRSFGILLAVYVAAGIVNLAALVAVAGGSALLGLSSSAAALAVVVIMTLVWALMDPMFFGVLYLLYYDLNARHGAAVPVSLTEVE